MIRGTKRALEKRPSVKANINASIHNRFDIEVVDAKTGEVKQRAQAFNVICDKLWEYALSSSASKYFNYIQYGSGTGTPAATDTKLFNRVGSEYASGKTVVVDEENFTGSLQRKISILETTAVGVEITEVGISKDSSNNLCTHAMLQDMNGNQISILKTDTDIINIYATIFVRFPQKCRSLSDDNDIMLCNLAIWVEHLCGWDSNEYYPGVPSYNQLQYSTSVSAKKGLYTAGSGGPTVDLATKTATYKYSRLKAANNNLPGGARYVNLQISSVNSDYAGSPLAVIKTAGTSIVGEAVGTGDGVTVDFATKFDCPKNAVVKVDGVAVDAVVEPAPLRYQNMDDYFHEIKVINGKPEIVNRGCAADKLVGTRETSDFSDSYNWSTFYNPHHEYGIASYGGYLYDSDNKVLVSDDLETWHQLERPNYNRKDVPAEYAYYKYWRLLSYYTYYLYQFYAKDLNGTNIHFATPPAQGAVITIDYDTEVLGKDENHVYDFEFSFTLGEYNPDA